jgi:hypothetical protein
MKVSLIIHCPASPSGATLIRFHSHKHRLLYLVKIRLYERKRIDVVPGGVPIVITLAHMVILI